MISTWNCDSTLTAKDQPGQSGRIDEHKLSDEVNRYCFLIRLMRYSGLSSNV